jgi:hypothetical protein
VDTKAIIQLLRDKGRVALKDGQGHAFELIAHEKWNARNDGLDSIFLLYDLFQIRSIAIPFSDVSLDIVEFTTKPIIYHTPVSTSLADAPIVDGQIRFAMIKEGNWNRLLFNFSKLVIYQNKTDDDPLDFEVADKFPLIGKEVKEMFLGPEGEVKILNG